MSYSDREMFDAVCDECHQPCKLPFKPDGVRKVFCKECFYQRKAREKYGVASD